MLFFGGRYQYAADMVTIERIRSRLAEYQPRHLHSGFEEAGVLVAVTREDDPRVILTRRTQHLSKHSGQVAFPGGRHEPGDHSLAETALRESSEEIGLPPGQVELIGQLSEVLSRYRIAVTPSVGLIPPDLRFVPDPHEIESVFSVPLRFFLEIPPTRVDHLGFEQYRLRVPCWEYQDYEIWGLSAIILMDFLTAVFDWRLPGGDDLADDAEREEACR